MNIDLNLAPYQPPAGAAFRALGIAQQWLPPEILLHSVRAWVLAEQLAVRRQIESFDREALFVAALLHDVALLEPFDAHRTNFETASGAVGAIAAAAFGWDRHRSALVAETIEAHMRDSVDGRSKPEAHLLEAATAADVSGRDIHLWDAEELKALEGRFPRAGFAQSFATLIAQQAARKPDSPAAELDRSGRIQHGDGTWRSLLGSEGAPGR